MADWKKNTVHEGEITGYTAEGMGVARLDGRVVFIPGTIAGERWRFRLEKVNKTIAWGRGIEVLSPSPLRRKSDCPLFGRCGGCQFRHMDYTEELRAKGARIQDAISRIGGSKAVLLGVLGADNTERYRNKVQFPVAQEKDGLAVGYYRGRSHSVLDVEDCLLQPEVVTALRAAFKGWMERYAVPPYDEVSRSGLIRHFYVRTNSSGESLCCVVANGTKLPYADELVQTLRSAHSGLAGLVLNLNREDTNVILGREYRTLWGRDWLEEELCGLSFRLSVPSFFQINRAQTQRLYALALEYAGLTGEETVLDLYCGIGTISLCLAQKAGKVIGAEVVPQAIEDAKANALRNGVANAEFFCGDAGQIAAHLAQQGVRPQVICVDPPRKGLAPEVPEILAGMAPERIVYVSCDPATLARDIKRFSLLGYEVVRAQGVDLFPRTQHVEVVCALSKLDIHQKITVDLKMDELDVTAAETKATYEEIREYVKEHTGLNVSNLYIAQVKQKCGIKERANYNKPKSENSRQPKCPTEKEKAIRDALKHFKMI